MTDEYARWVDNHRADYNAVLHRVQRTRDVFLRGENAAARSLLEMAYTFAVLSIQTQVDRTETAFTAYYAGDATLPQAAEQTVYHNQKTGWLAEGYVTTDWPALVGDLRDAVADGDRRTVLTRLTELTGLSYRKAGFTAALCGAHELMCIDTNVARFANIDRKREVTDADDYIAACDAVGKTAGGPLEAPFLVQWSVFDYQRGEHVTHLPFYREVLPQNHLEP
jgi:hypothetical protein